MPVKKRAKKTSVKTSVGSFVFYKFCVLAALFGAISAILFFVSLVQIPLSPPSKSSTLERVLFLLPFCGISRISYMRGQRRCRTLSPPGWRVAFRASSVLAIKQIPASPPIVNCTHPRENEKCVQFFFLYECFGISISFTNKIAD